jgi:hypothetical protein
VDHLNFKLHIWKSYKNTLKCNIHTFHVRTHKVLSPVKITRSDYTFENLTKLQWNVLPPMLRALLLGGWFEFECHGVGLSPTHAVKSPTASCNVPGPKGQRQRPPCVKVRNGTFLIAFLQPFSWRVVVEVDSGAGAREDSPPLNLASSSPSPRRFSACPSLSLMCRFPSRH